MTPKAARKLLRKYNHQMMSHKCGNSTAPDWLLRLWKKCTSAALKDDNYEPDLADLVMESEGEVG